jgi:hypothetical protein
MTRFLKKHNLKGGDEITLKCDENGFYMIEYRRKTIQQKNKITTLKLSNSWKVINF